MMHPTIMPHTKLQDALKLLSMPKAQPDASFYMRILHLCINKKAEKQAQLIHSQIITNGFKIHLHVSTKLVIFYMKIGDMVSARKVFDKMPEKSVVTWTAMISGYSQSEYYEDALLMFSRMLRAGFKANQFTYGSALRSCTGLRCLVRGMQIQGCVQKGRFLRNLFVQSALLDLHAKCGRMNDACCLFETMAERDVVSWNVMISGFAVHGFVDDSFGLFQEMRSQGKIPDHFTFGSLLGVLKENCSLLNISQVHGLIVKSGFQTCNELTGSLIDAYAKCGSLQCASQLYKGMLKKDIISFTSLITMCAREGKYSEEALSLFKEITSLQIRMDNVVVCSMLSICANIAELSLGKQIHAFALKCQPINDMAMGNALIDMYSKSGEIKDASKVFSEMETKNVISWTSLIAGYGKHGYVQEAIELFKKMEYQGVKPNDITFLSVLFACSHTGLVCEGSELFNSMVSKYKIVPQAKHLSCMVDLLARQGHLEAAYNLIHAINVKPNSSVWGALLGACGIYGNISLGELAAKRLFDMDPDKSVNYVALASTYSATGAWGKAWQTRKLMNNRRAAKKPGYSILSSAQ